MRVMQRISVEFEPDVAAMVQVRLDRLADPREVVDRDPVRLQGAEDRERYAGRREARDGIFGRW